MCAPKEEKAMKKKNPLGLRVLSAAAVMSIVTSIAAPAFADVYYIGNGSIDVITEEGTDYVTVKQGDKEYHDTSSEIVLKDGTSEKDTTLKEKDREKDKQAKEATPVETAADAKTSAVTTIGETERTPVEEETKEEEPKEEEPKEEEPEEEEPKEEEPKEEEPEEEEPKEEEPKEEEPKEEETKEEETKEEESKEEEPKEEESKEEESKEEEPKEEEQKIVKAPAKQQLEAAPQEAATQGDATDQDETEPPAKGSEGNYTNNVIRVINNWAKEKILNIRLSNVHIKADGDSKYQNETVERDPNPSTPSMKVDGSGNTTIELDGQNVLDESDIFGLAALNKQGDGTMTITDTTNDQGKKIDSKEFDTDKSGSLKVTGGNMNGGAGIGGNVDQAVTKNITIEGFATVDASAGNGAGIGGGGGYRKETSGNAENIIIQGNAHVKAEAGKGAGIGGGRHVSSDKTAGSAKKIVIRDHANVVAESDVGAGIGSGGWIESADAEVTIGTAGADSTQEDVHVTAKSNSGAAIGGSGVRSKGTTKVTIQGNATIEEASSDTGAAIGSPYGNTTVTIKDHAHVKKASAGYSQLAIGGSNGDEVEVNLEGNAVLDEVLGAIGAGSGVKNTVINIKDNVKIGTIATTRGWGGAIGGETARATETNPCKTVIVNIGGGKDGTVEIGTKDGVTGDWYVINGTKVTLGKNILLKLKQGEGSNASFKHYEGAYLSQGFSTDFFVDKGDKGEMKVGKTKEPEKGGLLNTIDANSAIWYTDYYNRLVKIVHGENLCVWDEGTVTVQPTCDTPGKKVHHCIYETKKGAKNPCCDRTWEEVLPATGHKWDDGKVTTPATCTTAGVKTYTCTTCNETKTETIKALGHDYEGQAWETKKEATCTEAGEKVLHCKRAPNDPNHDKTEVIPATGHDYRDDWTVTTEPGCTTKGEETRHCHNNPEHTETRDIAPTGHEHTHIEGKKDPTETEPGYTGDEVCDKCGDVVKKGEVIPATGKKDADNAEALELRVVVPGNTLRDLLFTVRQAGTERTYTCKKADATLTGTLETLQYLQANGTETIVFVTNGRVSRFAVADLLALCNEGDVFYLCHTADAEPTLLIIANDHTELLNK